MGKLGEVQISVSTNEAHWAPATPANVCIVLAGTSCRGEVEQLTTEAIALKPETCPVYLAVGKAGWPLMYNHPDPIRDAPPESLRS